MSTTTNLGITKLEVGQAQKEATINEAFDTFDAVFGAIVGARVYHNANQSISNTTITALAFNSERFDTDTTHDTSSNNSRLTCKTAGKYQITGQVRWASNATGIRLVFLRVNGSDSIAAVSRLSTGTVNDDLNVTTVWSLAVNDYVEVCVYQDSGGSLNVTVASNFSPEFMMHRVGG